MKISAHLKSCTAWLMAAFTAMSTLTACDSAIYDGEGDCDVHYRINFRYDMNMKFADAFAHEVNSVTLYVFDEQGNYITEQTDKGAALAEAGYSMPLDLPAGKYHLIAWCGLDNGESFTVPAMTSRAASVAKDLTCTLNRKHDADGAYVDEDLHRLFHGELDVTLGDYETVDPGTYTLTMPLVKNTNVVRVVLQHLSGQDLNADDFTFDIIDNNGLMAHDNALMPDEKITYHAWATDQGEAGVADDSGVITNVKAAIAEMTVARLVSRKGEGPMLVIRERKDNRTIVSIPLIDYALLVKGNYNRPMSDQEYLDRQDEYNLVFFLDENNNWLSSTIIINSWRVVLQNADL